MQRPNEKLVPLYIGFTFLLGVGWGYLDHGRAEWAYLVGNGLGYLMLCVALGYGLNFIFKSLQILDYAIVPEPEVLDAAEPNEALARAIQKMQYSIATFKYSFVGGALIFALSLL